MSLRNLKIKCVCCYDQIYWQWTISVCVPSEVYHKVRYSWTGWGNTMRQGRKPGKGRHQTSCHYRNLELEPSAEMGASEKLCAVSAVQSYSCQMGSQVSSSGRRNSKAKKCRSLTGHRATVCSCGQGQVSGQLAPNKAILPKWARPQHTATSPSHLSDSSFLVLPWKPKSLRGYTNSFLFCFHPH